ARACATSVHQHVERIVAHGLCGPASLRSTPPPIAVGRPRRCSSRSTGDGTLVESVQPMKATEPCPTSTSGLRSASGRAGRGGGDGFGGGGVGAGTEAFGGLPRPTSRGERLRCASRAGKPRAPVGGAALGDVDISDSGDERTPCRTAL